jgi:hypothetical protein
LGTHGDRAAKAHERAVPRILEVKQTAEEIVATATENGETAVVHYRLDGKKSDKVYARIKNYQRYRYAPMGGIRDVRARVPEKSGFVCAGEQPARSMSAKKIRIRRVLESVDAAPRNLDAQTLFVKERRFLERMRQSHAPRPFHALLCLWRGRLCSKRQPSSPTEHPPPNC